MAHPDYSKVRMTVVPALSESFPYIQGASVKSSYWTARTLPALGRGPDKLFFSSSAGIFNVSDKQYFDDCIVGKIAVVGESIQAEMSSEAGKLETRFAYDYIGYTWGIPDNDPIRTEPYRDKNYFNPVQYLINSASMTWPVVLEDPAAVDTLDYNGVLEPLTIRTRVGMSSTFVGDHLDPEPHCIRGVFAGGYAEEPYRRSSLITHYIEPDDSNRNYPFSYVVDWRIYEGFSRHVPDSTYTANNNKRIKPFHETTINEIVFAEISDVPMQNYFIHNVTSASLDSRPSLGAKTLGCGHTYENCIFGTDSVSYGGLLK
jgi:hypothetical protein